MMKPIKKDPVVQREAQATLKCIADQLGVSATTVSRALSGQASRYRISAQTESAVRQLARELNFAPNPLARGLRLKKTLTIGLIIPDISNPFFAAIAHEVTVGARKQGYAIILCDSQEDTRIEAQSIALLSSHHVEGIVICPVGLSSEHLSGLGQPGLPVVYVDRYFPKISAPYVGSDNCAGAKEATGYLIDHGHRRIACLQGLRGTLPNELRLRGYREALAERQLPVDDSLIAGDSFGEQSGYIETKLLLQSKRGVTALLAFSNLIALGALRALAEEKLKIPDDVSIIAFDDQPYAAYLATPITTVAQPLSEMGEVAVKLLFDQIHSPQQVSRGGILLPTRLIVRRSVKNISQSKTL